MTDINVIVDGKTVIGDFDTCKIDMAEGNFCNSVDLSFVGNRIWSQCEPTTNFGDLRIKVVIGDTTHEFLMEDRDTKTSVDGINFSVWGRSKQAYLTAPYAESITDTESTSHPWQSGNVTVSEIISYIITNYCNGRSVTVNWTVEDFIVYEGSFSVSNQYPVDVISSLAGVIGAEMIAETDGSLTIQEYSVEEGASVASFTDIDDMFSLGEGLSYPTGKNAVVVYGKSATGNGTPALAVQDVSSLDFRIEQETTVKVYYWNPNVQPIDISASYSKGTTRRLYTSAEEVEDEVVTLSWGVGSKAYPDAAGDQAVTDSTKTTTPVSYKTVSYTRNFVAFAVKPNIVGPSTVEFYYTDRSASAELSFTTIQKAGVYGSGSISGGAAITTADGQEIDWDICSGLVMEKVSPTTPSPGDAITIRVFGDFPSASGNLGDPTFTNSAGVSVSAKGNSSSEAKSETVTFSNGSATLSYPVGARSSSSVYDIDWQAEGIGNPAVRWINGSKKLYSTALYDDDEYKNATAIIAYYTSYQDYTFQIPPSYTGTSFSVSVSFGNCESGDEETLSIDISNVGTSSEFRDITVTVKDYVTGTAISGASVWIDNVSKGTTNASGLLNVSNVSVGDHTIKITASGYEDSDLDDLSNDSFVVS